MSCICTTHKQATGMMQYREIYEKTLEKWGEKAQYDQLIEECAELIATLKHYERGKANLENVVDELADVYLMVGQLAYMLGEDRLQQAVTRKIAKLQDLLETGD